ncbi:peptidoglycan recognition protein family protein [Salana multivorans]
MVVFRTQFVALTAASRKNVSTNPNEKRGIAVHLTGNTGRGANAQAHANLQSRPNPRVASWHHQIDDRVWIQSWPHSIRTFHAGTAYGNRAFISLEGCVNVDGDYHEMFRNLAYAAACIRREENIPQSLVLQHNDFSGKNCPDMIRAGRDGLTWAVFLTLVATFYAQGVTRAGTPTQPAPTYHPITIAQMEALAILGFYDGRLDGVAGPMTHAAVTAFQRAHGLVADGQIGPLTQPILNREAQKMLDQIRAIVREEIHAFNTRGVKRPGDPAANPEGRVELVQEIADAKTLAQSTKTLAERADTRDVEHLERLARIEAKLGIGE